MKVKKNKNISIWLSDCFDKERFFVNTSQKKKKQIILKLANLLQ